MKKLYVENKGTLEDRNFFMPDEVDAETILFNLRRSDHPQKEIIACEGVMDIIMPDDEGMSVFEEDEIGEIANVIKAYARGYFTFGDVKSILNDEYQWVLWPWQGELVKRYNAMISLAV